MFKTRWEAAPAVAEFYSDIHLFHKHNGAASIHAQKIYASSAKEIYLIGDVIDFEKLLSDYKFVEPPAQFSSVLAKIGYSSFEHHLRVIDALFYQAERGTRIKLSGGNHDPGFFLLNGQNKDGIEIADSWKYTALDGRRYHIEHGQHFDRFFKNGYKGLWVELGCRAMDTTLWADYHVGRVLKGYDYNLTNKMKQAFKESVVLNDFKNNAFKKAVSHGDDGIIAGHIHYSENTHIYADQEKPGEGRSIHYINTGDGLTHGSSQVHSEDGRWRSVPAHTVAHQGRDILDHDNPLKTYRPLTMAFLQTAWEKELEYATLCEKGHIKPGLEKPALVQLRERESVAPAPAPAFA